METENSLYDNLCRFFVLIEKGSEFPRNQRICSQFNVAEVEKEIEQKKRIKRNGFKALLSFHSCEESIPDDMQLCSWLFKLRSSDLDVKSDSIEQIIGRLEQSGQLQYVLPVLKVLFQIQPVQEDSLHFLQSIDPHNVTYGDMSSNTIGKDLQCIPYTIMQQKHFEIPPVNYHTEELYSCNIIGKLESTHQLDKLDVLHCNLFGALENPPMNLNYLGISKCSKFKLGLKDFITEIQPPVFTNPECESPNVTCKSLPIEEQFGLWEDVENLCDSSVIRRTWEAKLSGDLYPTKELPYLSQAPLEVMEALCYHFEENLNLVDENLPRRESFRVDEKEFRKNVLYLSLGIESKVFARSDDGFFLNGHPFVDGLSTECLSDFVQPLLLCGQLVRSIREAVWKSEFGSIRNTLVDQLQSSLQLYEQLIREIVESQSLISIGHRLKKILPVLELMNQLWHWPGWQSKSGSGVAFLQYLVNLSSACISNHERNLLTAYFASCVCPFLKYLENWLYHGSCCDPQQEFCIRLNNNELEKRDRNYWTNGFVFEPAERSGPTIFLNSTIEEDAVLGLLNDVYTCGKTVHLLQLCQVKEVALGEPSLRIGLCLSELNEIRNECKTYALKSPPLVNFVQPIKDFSQQARQTREAKLAELLESKQAKDLDRAVKRSARHALAKAELDEQLELKRAEQKKKDDQEKLLEEDIRLYQETIDKREANEKRRLLIKYAGLLDDQDNVTEDPPGDDRDDENANEGNEVDNENNMIIQREPPREALTASPATTSVSTAKSTQLKRASHQTTTKASSRPSKKHLTREEIKTKVLWEEFGIDPRYTQEDLSAEESSAVLPAPYVSKDWIRPVPTSYPFQFNFSDAPDDTAFDDLKRTAKGQGYWLQKTQPSEEEIGDFSLSFFVQRSLLLPIRTQCQIVNRSLMGLLTGPNHRFMQHLEALRQYVFLDNGSFSHSLVSNIGRRLGQLTHIHQLINVPSMNFVLQSALNAVHADDYHASRLSFYIKEANVSISNSQLEALECFTLRYRVGWPLNLILTEEVMDDYSQIFSFVLQLRLAAWALEDVYVNLMKEPPSRWHAVHIARHSIYHFVQTMQSYVMNQLLTLAWTEFISELKKNAHSLDDLYNIHFNYVHRAKSRLLLTPKSASLMKIIRDALNLALKFRAVLLSANYTFTPSLQSQISSLNNKAREYAKFIRLILEKVNDRSHQSHLIDLLVKLNFNDYYSS